MSRVDGTKIDKSDLQGLRFLGKGGQAAVYDAPNVRIHNTAGTVFKEYHAETLQNLDHKALQSIVEFPGTLSPDEGTRLFGRAAWPAFTVTDANSVVGFLMPKVPREFQLSFPGESELSLAESQHLFQSDDDLADMGIKLSDQKRYHLIREVAEGLMFFHSYDIFVGDFSAKNLLFSIDRNPRVYFIDCDSMRFRGASVLPQGKTQFWNIPDKNEQMATPASDTYKFGLFALRLFTGEQDSRSPKLLPKTVPRKLRNLIDATLTAATPRNRPALAEWPDVANSAAKRASRQPAKKRKAPQRTNVQRSSARIPVNRPRSPTPARKTATRPSFKSSSFPTKVTLVLGAIIGFVVAGLVAGIVSFIVAAIPVWIYTLIATSGPSFDTIQGFIIMIAGVAGGVFGAVLGADTARSSPRFVQVTTGIVVSIIALIMYLSYWDIQNEAMAENFQLLDSTVSESITPDGELIAPSTEFLGPRRGIALSAAYDQAVPGKTSFVFELFKEQRGRHNRVVRCSDITNKSQGRLWCNRDRMSQIEFGVGSYVLRVKAKTYGVTKTQQTEFVIRSAEGALVARVQKSLGDLGYSVGRIDGIYGRKTSAAIKEFQSDADLPIDGLVTEQLVNGLEARRVADKSAQRKNSSSQKSSPDFQFQKIWMSPSPNRNPTDSRDVVMYVDPATSDHPYTYHFEYAGAVPGKTSVQILITSEDVYNTCHTGFLPKTSGSISCIPANLSLSEGSYNVRFAGQTGNLLVETNRTIVVTRRKADVPKKADVPRAARQRRQPRELATTRSYRGLVSESYDVVVLTDESVVMGPSDTLSFSSITSVELVRDPTEPDRWKIIIDGRSSSELGINRRSIDCRHDEVECKRFHWELTKAFTSWKKKALGS